MPIVYKKGSLFLAPKGSILVHACNAKGIWGSGIAKEFKKLFPLSYEYYQRECLIRKVGEIIIPPFENGYGIVCLVTSDGYGRFKDSPTIILENTYKALKEFLRIPPVQQIHSCKFNSGLFGIEWEKTESVLNLVIAETVYFGNWTIWEL